MRTYEKLGHPAKILDLKDDTVDFTCVIFKVLGGSAYPLGLDESTLMSLSSVSPPLSRFFYCVNNSK